MNETKKMGFWQKVKARRLANTVYVMFVFTLLFLASVFGFYIAQDGTVAKEIFLGLFTSLLASICIIAFEFYTKYKDFENSEFIDNLYSFGIHNLYFNKQDVLAERIDSATQEIWISGYRLILTAELLPNIANALDRGCKLRILCCPPFTDSYRLIFGSENENKAIINNYFKLLEIVTSRHADFHEQCVIRFTETPLFNDTYKVDDKIITSPYMHNKDIIHGTILAKDFFTYELDEKYRL
ncbi:MAG: phospholipase D family protein, partial [Bifidobacteriaceae bacterium]|nr:phospholipase D family protein [Bifidobacteriaceae bacterium]